MNKTAFFLILLACSLTSNAMHKHQKKLLKEQHKKEKKARKRAIAAAQLKLQLANNHHDVNCNGKCSQCAGPELMQQSIYDHR